MMTLKEFGVKLKESNQAYEVLKKKCEKQKIGEIIEVTGMKWKVLDKLEEGYLVIADEFCGKDREFDDSCNDWKSSDLRLELNTDLKKKIEDELGKGSLVWFERDLFSLDGQREYEKCKDYVSLITVDEYRKYRKLLPNTNKWWWTLTPYSTSCNDDSGWLAVVSPFGCVSDDYCGNCCGVRPVCIFSYSIFESEEDDK